MTLFAHSGGSFSAEPVQGGRLVPAVVIDLWFLAVAVSYVMLELKLALDRTRSSCSGSAAHDARMKVVRVG